MIRLQLVLTGGFGNQVLQYLAGQYLVDALSGAQLSYSLSPYLEQRYRQAELLRCGSLPLAVVKRSLQLRLLQRCLQGLSPPLARQAWNAASRWCRQLELQERFCLDASRGDGDGPPLERALEKLRLLAASRIDHEVVVNGFWQDPRPYLTHLDRLASGLDWPIGLLPEAWRHRDYLTLHLRRGDYCESLSAAMEFGRRHSVVGFALNALAVLPSDFRKLPLLVLSDDAEWCHLWCHSLAQGDRDVVILSSQDPLVDWMLMKQARLNMIANSTFSFTAALLNQRNQGQKLRCLMPAWFSATMTTAVKGWTSMPGALEL